MIIWMLAIGLSVAGMIVAAAARTGNVNMAYAHLVIAACMGIFFALDGVRRVNALAIEKMPRATVAAEGIRATGMIWIWASVVIVLTYATGILSWKEWLPHFIGMFFGAGICLLVATSLANAAVSGSDDQTMMTVGRILLVIELVAMLAVMFGFMLDGQMKRFLVERFTDWPAKNVMFCGALAIAAISGATLKLIPSKP
jgi:hypothetical protein